MKNFAITSCHFLPFFSICELSSLVGPPQTFFLPPPLGETHCGTMSIAYTNGLSIALMVRLEDGQEAGTWAPVSLFDLADELFDMLEQFPDGRLELVTMRGSILYYTTSQMFHPSQNPCWVTSLCLETGQVDWLFARAYDAFFQPYHHLVWPSFHEATTKG
jgi:hypothetical protein